MRYVLAVAETGNFTRAAAQCFVVQSALSHQVKSLERELGLTLFARTSRRVELTSAGEAFLPAARACLEAAERAVVEAAAAAGQVRGRLSIGVIPTVTALDVPDALRRFRDAHPQVPVGLRVGSSRDFLREIREGVLDIALLGLPVTEPPRGVAHRELRRSRHLAVVPSGHRLGRRRRLRLADLAEEVFADFPAESPGRAQSDLAFTAAGLQRQVAFEMTAVDHILDLVDAGLAVALLPPGTVPDRPGLRTVPVVDGPERIEHLAWSDFNPSPASSAFLRVLGFD
ncbi:DNA-binding transcriptional LysR family regulator [Ornithinicoccus hortensis]|uniref:DNA-binding transcriptional LysR family regulator n=2 Tax=Ornithinicoccus hortensis TaxID=82346 RepID=A0A542YUH0_9MICO|nr:DNA-binding transcriptional LysR family regulator [Ornithinicoccus hortensis]